MHLSKKLVNVYEWCIFIWWFYSIWFIFFKSVTAKKHQFSFSVLLTHIVLFLFHFIFFFFKWIDICIHVNTASKLMQPFANVCLLCIRTDILNFKIRWVEFWMSWGNNTAKRIILYWTTVQTLKWEQLPSAIIASLLIVHWLDLYSEKWALEPFTC